MGSLIEIRPIDFEESRNLLPDTEEEDINRFWRKVKKVADIFAATELDENLIVEEQYPCLTHLALNGIADEKTFTYAEVEVGYRVYTGKSKLPGSYRSTGHWPELE